MNWWKTLQKVAKHAALSGTGAAVAVVQQSPSGEVDWQQVVAVAVTTALLAGLGGGGVNAAKHLGAPR